MQGGTPSKQEALDLSALLNDANTNLHQPVGLEQQLLQHLSLDEEVGQSMVQLLQVIVITNYFLGAAYQQMYIHIHVHLAVYQCDTCWYT